MASMSAYLFLSSTSSSPSRTFQTLNKPLSLSLQLSTQTRSSPPVHRARVLTIRASGSGSNNKNTNAAVSTADIMPRGVIESDRLSRDVRNGTMRAVDACRRRVTVGDVASKAGLKMDEAHKALQALAADTSGFLEVSDEGDVLYVFEKDYRSKLVGKSLRLKVEPFIEKAKSVGEYLVRVLFGTTLFASVVIVFTAIIVIIFALLASRSDDEDSEKKSSSLKFSFPSELFCDVFSSSWRQSGSLFNSGVSSNSNSWGMFWYCDPNYYRRRQMQVKSDDMNFLESVFSYVFGDGDPNIGLEERRWKLIGEYLATNGGVVTAEELAPYLDLESTEGDESYMLPVLLRFNGLPEVNEEGNILYRFPSLQRTGLGKKRTRCQKEYVGGNGAVFVKGVENFLKEKKLDFSKASSSQRVMTVGLGGLNIAGVITLGIMLQDSAVTQAVSQSGFLTFVSNIFPLLQIYAACFFVIPLVRWFIVNKRNKEIEKRNLARERSFRALELPEPSLRLKMLSARDLAQRISIGQDKIIYSTKNGKFEKEFDTKEWDRRYRETEMS